MRNKTIIHQISLTGIGGVQQSFLPYFKLALKKSKFNHKIYGIYPIDNYYKEIEKYYANMRNSPVSKFKFLYFLYSNNYIIHFYNNLGSVQIKKLFEIFSSKNIIFHERGTAWNVDSSFSKLYQFNANKAKIIIANSNATKIMLNQKLGIDEKKIKVIYNGFLSKFFDMKEHRKNDKFSIGFIGRFDTPKGAHIFINAAKKMKKYNFYLAGDGVLRDYLVKLSNGYKNINFVGRVKNPIEFIKQMDIIVVPSIREPLGNSIIEAGFCKKAVIASNVDGIPEIIENNKSGILLNPKQNITLKNLPKNAVPYPKLVVDPVTKKLTIPKEIDVEELCDKILELEKNEEKRIKMGLNLYKRVTSKFTIEKYFEEIENIYRFV